MDAWYKKEQEINNHYRNLFNTWKKEKGRRENKRTRKKGNTKNIGRSRKEDERGWRKERKKEKGYERKREKAKQELAKQIPRRSSRIAKKEKP